jgi:predicted AlkP superfamily phosphohydrolase/phosphomutase
MRGSAPLAGLVLATGLALPSPAGAWGFDAHRLAHDKAIGTLPAPLRDLFAGNRAYLREHALDPDNWAIAGVPGEGPNHYLDLDAFGAYPFDDIPLSEAEHKERHGPEATKQGRVPWRVGEVYRELVAAFKSGDAARTLERAAVLGHYVADSHVPLHAVVNYDGQLTGQKGVHGRWETELFARYERQIEPAVLPAAAERIGDPVAFIFTVLRESYGLAQETLAADRELAGKVDFAETAEDDRYDDAYYSRFFERERERFVARLAAAAHAVGSLWYSAWEEAGRPAVDSSFRFPYVRRQSRLILASLDGAGAALIEDAVARGLMPNLARLAARGASARGVVTTLPAKTPVAHATLFTGAWPDRHGITGSKLPRSAGSVLETTDGYRSDGLHAEPFWVTAARHGLDATTVAVTQTWPFAPYVEERRFGANYGRHLILIDGYHGAGAEEAVFTARDLGLRPASGWKGTPAAPGSPVRELELRVAGVAVPGLLVDDPGDPTEGLDTLLLSLDKDASRAVRLKPGPPRDTADAFATFALPTPSGPLPVYLRLFSLAKDGSELLLYLSRTTPLAASRERVSAAAQAAAGGFVGNSAYHAYRTGGLGPTLAGGGDGTAEERYLETAALLVRQFGRLFSFAAERTQWEVLVAYLPQPDEALHEWLGLLDSGRRGHDPALAARLRPYLDRLLRIVDGYVGALVAPAGEDTVVAVVSDHGQVAVDRSLRLNVALAKAGLLATQDDGAIDLARTRVVWASAGYFLINRVARPGGIVTPKEEDGLRAALAARLRDLRDPETGGLLVTRVLDPRTEGRALGLGGAAGGDLYVSLTPGYLPSAETRGELVTRIPPIGEHMLDPELREMQGMFVVAGPGVAAGTNLGPVRAIDIAPTLSALIGIDPPAQAEGVALGAALARPLRTGKP